VALQLDDDPTPRPAFRQIGKFRLERELGRGGMGVVYLSRQEDLGRAVALKVLPLNALPDAEAAERFIREAHSCARLHHEHIVQVYEAGRAEGHLYIAMEFLDGESLAGRVKRGALPPDETARLGARVARALQHAHESGVVHRDVKPENILVDRAGRPCLVDFGLARNVTLGALTMTGGLLGTPMYMSPEQAAGARDIDGRTDVYSLGLTLHALARGGTPYDATTPIARLLQDVQTVEPLPLGPDVPRDLRTIIAKASDKEPARRYATAAELADDLERYLRGEPIRARPLGLPARALRAARRRPVAAAGLAALVAGAGFAAWWFSRPGYATIDATPPHAIVRFAGTGEERPVASARRVPLAPGRHVVRIRAEGYVAVEREIDVARGAEALTSVALARETGTVVVEAPEGSEARVEGPDGVVGLSPSVPASVPTGAWSLWVARRGCESKRLALTVRAGAETRVKVALSSAHQLAYDVPGEPAVHAVASGRRAGALALVGRDSIALVDAGRATVPWGIHAPPLVGDAVLRLPATFPELIALSRAAPDGLWLVGDGGAAGFLPWGEVRLEKTFAARAPGSDVPRDALAWPDELWVLHPSGLERIRRQDGRVANVHPAPPAGLALALDDASQRWMLATAEELQLREGPERVASRVALPGATRAAAADLDGDGRRDAVLLDGRGTLRVIDGARWAESWTAAPVAEFCAADGVVVVLAPDGRMTVFDARGRPIGSWPERAGSLVRLGDLDSDGADEALAIDGSGVRAYRRTGGLSQDIRLAAAAGGLRDAVVCDANRDGLMDLAFVWQLSGGTLLLGRRGWSAGVFLPSIEGALVHPDVTDDGWPEVIPLRGGRVTPKGPAPRDLLAIVPDGWVERTNDGARAVAWDGRPLWTLADQPEQAVSVDGRFVAFDVRGTAIGLDAHTGRRLWELPGESLAAPPVAAGGRAFVVDTTGVMRAIDVNKGAVVWTRAGSAAEGVFASRERVVLAQAMFVVVDAATGRDVAAIHAGARAAETVLADDLLLLSLSGDRLRGVPLAGGEPWEYAANEAWVGRPAASPDGCVALLLASGELRVLDARTGTRRWSVQAGPSPLALTCGPAEDGWRLRVTMTAGAAEFPTAGRPWTPVR
jgi:predicted Ser/Thr protein kinase